MSLIDTLNGDLKAAMKARDKQALSVIRMLKSALMNEQINVGHDLTADEEVSVLSRELKQRRESLSEFENAGRQDLVDGVKAEIAIVEQYMPKQLSDEEVQQIQNSNRIPLIFIDSYSNVRQLINIGIDDYKGGQLAANYFF